MHKIRLGSICCLGVDNGLLLRSPLVLEEKEESAAEEENEHQWNSIKIQNLSLVIVTTMDFSTHVNHRMSKVFPPVKVHYQTNQSGC